MSQRIGIFGGSFNPPHVGHMEICKYLLDNGDLDKILIVPCFNHPFRKELAPYEDRLTMCKFAFAGHADKVVVSDIERDIGGPSHTVKTIERLIFNHPEDRFVLIVGSDTRKEMDGWKDAEKIKSMVRLITIPRGPDSHISNISSSDVRMSIKDGKSFEHLVSREIAVYIITHGLYS